MERLLKGLLATLRTKTVSRASCQTGMAFDVELQICNLRRSVDNCNQWQKSRKALPRWPLRDGQSSECSGTDIQCGSGECLKKKLFCDRTVDCNDGSDENICSPETNPNRAPLCDARNCHLGQGCFCSQDGTRIPGDLEPTKTPQMVLITFTGAVNERNVRIFQDIFRTSVKNKGNECSVKGTFFVSHAFTNYSAVQELHRHGHEIAANSITNTHESKYWSELPSTEYEAEFDGNRIILETFANISQGDIVGLRVPHGRVGGNEQFQMMQDWGFLYDSSLAAPVSRLPLWPYTLEYRMPHKCVGIDQNCPSSNFTIWEMVINELDRRDDPLFDETLTGCHYVDQCSLDHPEQFYKFLNHNLERHYGTNRAPFGLHFTAAYFETRKDFLREFVRWVDETSRRGDTFFVTMQQAIHWMSLPTEISLLNTFPEWKEKCDIKGLPYCSLPNPCVSKVPRLFPAEQNMYLHTCQECPNTYPWLYDPLGQGFDSI